MHNTYSSKINYPTYFVGILYLMRIVINDDLEETLSLSGEMMVIVEAISEEGELGYQTLLFEVEER